MVPSLVFVQLTSKPRVPSGGFKSCNFMAGVWPPTCRFVESLKRHPSWWQMSQLRTRRKNKLVDIWIFFLAAVISLDSFMNSHFLDLFWPNLIQFAWMKSSGEGEPPKQNLPSFLLVFFSPWKIIMKRSSRPTLQQPTNLWRSSLSLVVTSPSRGHLKVFVFLPSPGRRAKDNMLEIPEPTSNEKFCINIRPLKGQKSDKRLKLFSCSCSYGGIQHCLYWGEVNQLEGFMIRMRTYYPYHFSILMSLNCQDTSKSGVHTEVGEIGRFSRFEFNDTSMSG